MEMKVKPDIFTLLRSGHFYLALTFCHKYLTSSELYVIQKQILVKGRVEMQQPIKGSNPTSQEICFRIKIRFVGEKEVDLKNLAQQVPTPKIGAPPRKSPLADISPDDLAVLREFESKMLSWITASKKNAVIFAANPIAALIKAGLKVDRRFLKTLQRLRNKNIAIEPWFPGVRLSEITVEAKPTKRQFSPNPDLPFPKKSSKQISRKKGT